MWIFCWLWIVLIVESCKGTGDQYFSIEKVGSDTVKILEGDDATMTCSFTSSGIPHGTMELTWFKNIESGELINNLDHSEYTKLKRNQRKYLVSYNLRGNDYHTRLDMNSSEGSKRYVEMNATSSSLVIQNVLQSVHDGSYFCAIYTEAAPDFAKLAFDQITLSIYVEPELKVSIQENWIEENSSASITCSTQRVKPSVTNMIIKINNADKVKSEQNGINITEKEDKTFANSFRALVPVTRSDNGAAVSCEAIWNAPDKVKTIHSDKETLKVVWDIDTPMNFRVEPETESCSVSWANDPNAKWVTICHGSPSGVHCSNVTSVGDAHHEIDQLDPEESYFIWMYASNELGSSDNTTTLQCTPKTASSGLDIAVVGGVGGGALLLIIITSIVVIFCIVRKKPQKDDNIHTYANVDNWKKAPQVSASQPATNDEENPHDDPAVPKTYQELTREPQDRKVHDVIQMNHSRPPKSDAPGPLPKKTKKTKNNKKDPKPQEVDNGNAQDNNVTHSYVNHVTPPPIDVDRKKVAGAQIKGASEGKTYATVAFNLPKDKKKEPKGRRTVKETEYSAVQFKKGPRVADEDSD